MTRQVSTFSLRMPNSLKAAAARMAAAEKLSAIQTSEAYFSALPRPRGPGGRVSFSVPCRRRGAPFGR